MWYFGQLSDDHFSACTPQKMKCLCRHEPAKFCFLGALSAQLSMSAWLWDLCCFLIVIVSFSRLRSLSKEGGGHPRRSCVGVAARGGNPGQEGRNQGRRANERVSGETLFLPSLIFSLAVLCLVLVVFVLCQAVYLFFILLYYRLCLCFFVCLCLCLSRSVCFGSDTGSRSSDNSLLAPSVCVLVIVCDCTAASRGRLTGIPLTCFTDQPC